MYILSLGYYPRISSWLSRSITTADLYILGTWQCLNNDTYRKHLHRSSKMRFRPTAGQEIIMRVPMVNRQQRNDGYQHSSLGVS